jgi:hypothetical protein
MHPLSTQLVVGSIRCHQRSHAMQDTPSHKLQCASSPARPPPHTHLMPGARTTRPSKLVSSPARMRIRLDLPAPLAPSTPILAPCVCGASGSVHAPGIFEKQ